MSVQSYIATSTVASLLPGAPAGRDTATTPASTQTRQEQAMPDTTAICSFQVGFPETDLTELRRRIRLTRWPDHELVSDAASRRIWATPATVGPTQGVQLATMQKLIQYWGTNYDWSRCEARLKSLPHFMTEIDGLDIHFIHVKSKHQNALPMIVTHGWPGSVIEQLKIIEPLTNPAAHGGTEADAFHLVIPSMPGYGFFRQAHGNWLGSRAHCARVDRADEAPRLQSVCRARRGLGSAHHRTDGPHRASRVDRYPHLSRRWSNEPPGSVIIMREG
jgi:hypothetical protein